MLRDFVNKGREFADRMTNMMMNYTEVEIKVREATSDEAWGPHGQLLRQLAEYTFSHQTYLELMTTLWRRMLSNDGSNSWRRIYKSLIVLDHLLKNGSEQVINGAKEHIYDIRTLESFRYEDEIGRDQGINVRLKVKEIIDLLQDPDRLSDERTKVKSNRQIYTGFEGGNQSSWSGSFHGMSSHMSYDAHTDSFDHANSHRDRFGAHSGYESTDSRSNRLGSFDDWNVGRERGFVDDVVEQFREAWDVAKLSTKDLFTIKQPSNNYPHESNPRMVSEEMYSFPSEAAETDGTFEADFEYSRDRTDYDPHFNGARTVQASKAQNSTRRSNKVEMFKKPTSAVTKPRPPSVDLLGTLNQTNSASPPVQASGEPIDLLSWDNTEDSNKDNEFSNWTSAVPQSIHTPATNLLDSEFGDFVSTATNVKTEPVQPKSHSFDLTGLQPIVPSNTALNNSNPWVAPFTPSINTNQPWNSNKNSSSTTPAVNENLPQPSAKPVLGETWKELDSLQINLDSLVSPVKLNNRLGTGPSLRELQHANPTFHNQQVLKTGNPGVANFSFI